MSEPHAHPSQVLVHTGRAIEVNNQLIDDALARGDERGAQAWVLADVALQQAEHICRDALGEQTWERKARVMIHASEGSRFRVATHRDVCRPVFSLYENTRIDGDEMYVQLNELDRLWPNPDRATQLPNPAAWNRLDSIQRAAIASVIQEDSDRSKALAARTPNELDVFERSG